MCVCVCNFLVFIVLQQGVVLVMIGSCVGDDRQLYLFGVV